MWLNKPFFEIIEWVWRYEHTIRLAFIVEKEVREKLAQFSVSFIRYTFRQIIYQCNSYALKKEFPSPSKLEE